MAREQTEGFWSTEQTLSNADVGHYHTVSAVADKLFDDVDVKLLGAYRWFDSFGSPISRGQPYDTNELCLWDAELPVLAIGTHRQWQGLGRQPEMDRRACSSSRNRARATAAFEYLFLPSAGSAPRPSAGKQLTVTDWANNGERNTSYAGLCPGDL